MGAVKFAEEDGKIIAILTKVGKEKIKKFDFENMRIKKSAKWDGKWRLIIFDIEEGKKVAREFFRSKLKSLGFYQLQKSVYIYPYPCRKEIEILRANYGLSVHEVMYLLVDRFEGKKILIDNFN